MELKIKNSFLTVAADSLGAQLQYIRGADRTEYLWQGDANYWSDRAPVLFPYVARLTEGQYLYKGVAYHMPIHGFALSTEFIPEQISGTEMRFHLFSSNETKQMYPFDFEFTVSYRLEKNCLVQTYSVVNNGGETMYFGIGSHHGFHVPLSAGKAFEDYYLLLDGNAEPVRLGFSEDCFPDGNDEPFITDNRKLHLKHSMFDNDAIVLRNAGNSAVLQSDSCSHKIAVDITQIPYLALWHPPGTESPFICIEAWCSLPSRKGIIEDLERQPSLHALTAKAEYVSELRFCFS